MKYLVQSKQTFFLLISKNWHFHVKAPESSWIFGAFNSSSKRQFSMKSTLKTAMDSEIHVPISFGAAFDKSKYSLAPHEDQLQLRNAHGLDVKMRFDAQQHKYFFEDVPLTYSVTELIGLFSEKFDSDAAIQLMKNGSRWPRPEYTMRNGTIWTDHQIKQFWDAMAMFARNRGSWMHYNIERYWNGLTPANEVPEIGMFYKFQEEVLQKNDISPWRTEWRICDPSLSLAGSVDFVGRKLDGTFVLVDWKRTKRLATTQRGRSKKMKAPLDHLDDTELSKYSLQLNVYRYILQKHYGITVSSMILGVFHPTFTEYSSIEVPVLEKETLNLLDHISCITSYDRKVEVAT